MNVDDIYIVGTLKVTVHARLLLHYCVNRSIVRL